MARIDTREASGRVPSRGPAFVYVAPCAYEDLLKLGFSRDPLQRLQSLHPRFFEAFDLDRAALVATESVRDARAIELRLRRLIAEYNAPAPLVMRAEAAGTTEWFRGASDLLDAEVVALEHGGHTVHRPARDWFVEALAARLPLLYAWSEAMLPVDVLDGLAPRAPVARQVRDALDAYAWADIPLEPHLPPRVMAWYSG